MSSKDPNDSPLSEVTHAVDVDPTLEPRLAAADPLVRYCVFLADVVRRYRASPALRESDPDAWAVLRAEATLMHRDHEDAWAAGSAILAEARARAAPV